REWRSAPQGTSRQNLADVRRSPTRGGKRTGFFPCRTVSVGFGATRPEGVRGGSPSRDFTE
ncbi:hypothetical protein BGU93_18720, partial [Clostridioides difficile]